MTEIRKSKINDLEQIQDIARRTIDSNYRSFLGDKGVDWFIDSGASDQYLKDNINDCWILDHASTVIGFYVRRNNLIDLMMVDCNFHNQGFGSKLLEHCEQQLFTNFTEIKLESFEGNLKANNFYRKHDWIEKQRIFDKTSNAYKLIFIKNL